MAESELEGRLNNKVSQLQSQINSLGVYYKRLHRLITHPSTLARIKQYTDSKFKEITGDIEDLFAKFGVWTDYSTVSSIIGWSVFTEKFLEYKLIDDTMFVSVFLGGTSNNASVSFTLPYNAQSSWSMKCLHCMDNGQWRAVNGLVILASGSAVVTCSLDGDYTIWTDTNRKTIQGQFFYKIA